MRAVGQLSVRDEDACCDTIEVGAHTTFFFLRGSSIWELKDGLSPKPIREKNKKKCY